jgi:hypothetical protein
MKAKPTDEGLDAALAAIKLAHRQPMKAPVPTRRVPADDQIMTKKGGRIVWRRKGLAGAALKETPRAYDNRLAVEKHVRELNKGERVARAMSLQKVRLDAARIASKKRRELSTSNVQKLHVKGKSVAYIARKLQITEQYVRLLIKK